VVPLCILRAKAIGVLTMRDEKGQDDKIIAVHVDDPEYEPYQDIAELPPHRLRELERFFLDYKVLENKTVNVQNLRGAARRPARHPRRGPPLSASASCPGALARLGDTGDTASPSGAILDVLPGGTSPFTRVCRRLGRRRPLGYPGSPGTAFRAHPALARPSL
jgi:hypothetical protein